MSESEKLDAVLLHLEHLNKRCDALQAILEAIVPSILSCELVLQPHAHPDYVNQLRNAMRAYAEMRNQKIAKLSEFPFRTPQQDAS